MSWKTMEALRDRAGILARTFLPFWVALLAAIAACQKGGHQEVSEDHALDVTRYVDPFIGTRGEGNVIPGPCLPHGMVKLSPDTNAGPGSVDAYEYANDRIEGFSHTHLEGPGGRGYGYSQILLVPTTGPLAITEDAYASAFSHDTEEAHPGYYSVRLDRYNIHVELTATAHCGFHRYRFPASADARILIDVSHTRGVATGGHVEIVGDRAVQGYGVYCVHPLIALATAADPGTTAERKVYFYAEFDAPFSSFGTWSGKRIAPGSSDASGRDIGAFLSYETSENEIIQVKVGLSSIDMEQARENLAREIPEWDFGGVRERARGAWNDLLSRIEVSGGEESHRTQFYTALYHSLLQPTDYTEYGRFWSGADGKGTVFPADGRHYYSDDWCLWDTFRTTHPLQTLIEPSRRSDMVWSQVHLYEQGGWLDKCPWQATGYSRIMIGNHVICEILDAYAKGFQDFDLEKAYQAMSKSAQEDNANILSKHFCGYLDLGIPADYLELGYVPQECDPTQSVSMTLEYAYNDWCMAQMAKALGKTDDYVSYLRRSLNYTNTWNPAAGFMQPKSRRGNWVEPFDPAEGSGFCEADSWRYTWFVPHDPQGLIRLMGGIDQFVRKLDTFFDQGRYDPSNEPDFHVPYLYVYAGAPYKTQKRVREILETAFDAAPSGLPGNDDSGATSSWYVLSTLGLYPVCPGDPTYVIGSPLFEKVVLHLDPDAPRGRTFTIEAHNTSRDHPYIQAASLNGEALKRAWLHHSEIAAGGTLELEMGPYPSAWATEEEYLPATH